MKDLARILDSTLATLTFKAQWLLYVPPGGTVRSAHTVYLRVLQGSRPLSASYCMVFITEMVSVYCAVRTESLKISWVYPLSVQ
jgi:hypothetical protein